VHALAARALPFGLAVAVVLSGLVRLRGRLGRQDPDRIQRIEDDIRLEDFAGLVGGVGNRDRHVVLVAGCGDAAEAHGALAVLLGHRRDLSGVEGQSGSRCSLATH